MIRDRDEAAHLLAEKLKNYSNKNVLILAIPRGAVPMGKILALKLLGEFDVILVHKLCHPLSSEFAIGAIDEEGHAYVDESNLSLGIGKWLDDEKARQSNIIKNRRKLYTPKRSHISSKDRIVIIVDDGIATGWTMKAAIEAVQHQKPKEIIVATAIIARDALLKLEKQAKVIYLESPENFQALSQFFNDFRQVSDDEVVAILKQ